MTELLLVRHGQINYNVLKWWRGRWMGMPLSARGVKEAELLAQRLAEEEDIAAIHTSPLRRALCTAEAIAARLGLKLLVHEDLREADFGEGTGLIIAQLLARFPLLRMYWQDRPELPFTWLGGEWRAALFRRVRKVMKEIVAAYPDDKVVVVAHRGIIRVALAQFLPKEMEQWWTYAVNNASLTRLKVGQRINELLSLNDCSHLLSGQLTHDR